MKECVRMCVYVNVCVCRNAGRGVFNCPCCLTEVTDQTLASKFTENANILTYVGQDLSYIYQRSMQNKARQPSVWVCEKDKLQN